MKNIMFADHHRKDIAPGVEPMEFPIPCVLCGEVVFIGDKASDASPDGKVFNPQVLVGVVEVVIGKECMLKITEGFMSGLEKSVKNQEQRKRDS